MRGGENSWHGTRGAPVERPTESSGSARTVVPRTGSTQFRAGVPGIVFPVEKKTSSEILFRRGAKGPGGDHPAEVR